MASTSAVNRPALLAACVLASLVLHGQENPASLRGTVRDTDGHPLATVTVQLKTGDRTLSTKSDSQGTFGFQALPAGTFSLHAELSGKGEATVSPLVIMAKEDKIIDLTLAAQKPEFYDQPTFIVAGVTDSASRGGHGSDAILRSSEALAKATASLGDLKESRENALQAAREYQRAAEQDPSERNLFDWGAELLAHRANAPASEVFNRGHRLFAHSTRMLLGLAVALYANGAYDQAAQRFFEASDLNPSDPGPYLFLAKVESSAITEFDGYLERMRRFAELQPDNARANFYYAASLWKKGDARQAEALLKKALQLDPRLADAHLQLGIIYFARQDFPQAIAAFEHAIVIDPQIEEAHYRLAQTYARTGENERAQEEFEIHNRLAKESAQQVERERRGIQQFVIELRKP
jgi:tetratricopeptide (TPR) repeat protein